MATLGTSCFGVWLLGEMGFYGVYYVFLFWLWMGFCAWVLRFWRRALGEKMEQCYFSFTSGVVRVYCGPFQAFKVSDLYLDSYLYFSQQKKKKKKNPIYLFIIYKFYCYKLNHNFCQLFTKITGPCKSDNQS